MNPHGPVLPLRRRMVAAVIIAAAVTGVAILSAQQIWVGGSGYTRPRSPLATDFNGAFMFCRGLFRGGWATDYPGADHNFSVRLAELTRIPVKFDPNRQPHHVVISLTDPLLYRCPLLFMLNIGSARFSPEEILRLREYFLKGGFLWVDDSWGSRAWDNWISQLTQILPPAEFPIFDIPPTHPVMRTLYDVKAIPQVPNIDFWRGTGGQTSERGRDSAEVYFKGIQDSRNRLMVLMTHNTDISDTWEREGEEPQAYFNLFSPTGYAIGVNVVLYAMTH